MNWWFVMIFLGCVALLEWFHKQGSYYGLVNLGSYTSGVIHHNNNTSTQVIVVGMQLMWFKCGWTYLILDMTAN